MLCTFLAPFSSVFHTPELGRCLKSNNFGKCTACFSSRIVYYIYKRYLESTKKFNCGSRVSLHKLIIARDDLHQCIDEIHRKDHQYRYCDRIFYGLPTYDLWYLRCILYHIIFGFPLCNVYNQQINILMSVFIYHYFHFFAIFILLLLAFLSLMLITLLFLEIIENCGKL